MPNLPAKLAMFESDVPPAERWREKSPGQLAGPQRGGADSPFPPRSLAKFHAPEIVFGPGALTELGHCAGRLGARRPFLVTDPGLIEAGWAAEALAYLRQHGLRATAWHDVTPNPKNSEIEAGFERYAESGGDVIIGLGGSSIDAVLGATHAMSHQVGGLLDLPHGVLNAVLLPHVIRFNAQAAPERFVPLAAAGGVRIEGVPAGEVALLLAERVRGLADEVGVPKRLAALGVSQDMLPQLARTTLKDACLTTNPREAGVGDIEALFRAAL